MRRSPRSARRSSHRVFPRAVALAAVAALGVAGLPAVAHAADGTISNITTNGLAVAAASNSATASVAFTTSDSYLYNELSSGQFRVTFSRSGATTDAITASITGTSPAAPAPATRFTVNVNLVSANPGFYDIALTGPTASSSAQLDKCIACFSVLSGSPTITSVTPTGIAQAGSTVLTVRGSNFAKGNYPGPDSNYACVSCPGAPRLEVRVRGASVPDPAITLSDPSNGSGGFNPIEATSTAIGKVITIAPDAALGARDIFVQNSDGREVTFENALTVDSVMKIGTVAPATRGQGSTAGTLTLTGTDFPSDVQGTIAGTGLSFAFVRDSDTQVRFTNLAVTASAATGPRTITLSSASQFASVTSTAFSVAPAPAPTSVSLPNSTVGKYGQGATGVEVVVAGANFTAGTGTEASQLEFTPSTGVTVSSLTATASGVTAVVSIDASAPTGTVAVAVRNPDGGRATCSSCTFGINPAPAITEVSPNSQARGQSTSVTLTGTNLADGTNKSAPTVTVTNATHGAVVATSATSVAVSALLAGTSASGLQNITIVNNDDKGTSVCVGCFTITNLSVTGTTGGSAFNEGTPSATAAGTGFDPTATVELVKTGAGSATAPAIQGVVTAAPVESPQGAANGTSITANFPLSGVDPGTYAFRVTNPGDSPFPGVGQGGSFTVVGVAPTVTSVSPNSRGAGAVEQTIVVTGTNFGPSATLSFSNPLVHIDTVTRDSATQITAVVHIDSEFGPDTVGAGSVMVTNTDNQQASADFLVVVGPQITSVDPGTRGQGAAPATLTLKGTPKSFPKTADVELTVVGATGVTLAGLSVTAGSKGTPPLVPAVEDTLTGTVTVADSATIGTYDVVLVDSSTGGRDVCVACFRVTAKPTLASVAPGSGAVGTSAPVTLTGTGFLPSLTVAAGGGITVSNVTRVSATSVTATFTIPAGATPNTDVDVRLTNADGGFAVLASAFHLYGKPGAPTGVTATPGDREATVSWTAPVNNGGAAVTSYTVTSGAISKTVSGTSATVTGLTNGTTYTFSVVATNAAGNGPSAAANPVTPAAVPGPPTGVTATPGNGEATVTWTAPTSNGGAPVTSYTVTSGAISTTVSGTSTTVSGLTNGTAYTFTVRATNSAGDSAESAPSAPVTPRTVPGAPTGVTATPGEAKATVSWTAPTQDGGAPVTGYTVTGTPDGATVTVDGNTTTTEVTGLANGTAYTFTVRATNAAGHGPQSAPSSAVTPGSGPGSNPSVTTAPTAPQAATATAGDRRIRVTWTAPASNGGAAITHYAVSLNGGTPVVVDDTLRGVTIGGLANGTSYVARVSARNSVGDGPQAAAAAVTPKYVVSGTIARSTIATTYGGTVKISGRFTRSDGKALAGRSVGLYSKVYGTTKYRRIATVTTSSTGYWSSTQKPAKYTRYAAAFWGDSADLSTVTSSIAVAVRYRIYVTSPSSGSTVKAGAVTVRARVYPWTPGASGYLVYKRSDGSVKALAKAYVSSKGYLVLSRNFSRGTYYLAVHVSKYNGSSTQRTAFFRLRVV